MGAFTWLTHDTQQPIFTTDNPSSRTQPPVHLKLPPVAMLPRLLVPAPAESLIAIANAYITTLVTHVEVSPAACWSEAHYEGYGNIAGLDAHGVLGLLNLPTMLSGGVLAKKHAEEAFQKALDCVEPTATQVQAIGDLTQKLRHLGISMHNYEKLPANMGFSPVFTLQFSFTPGPYDPAAQASQDVHPDDLPYPDDAPESAPEPAMNTFAHRLMTCLNGINATGIIVTDAALAAACKTDETTFAHWKSGESTQISYPQGFALAEALGTNPHWLASGEGSPEHPIYGEILQKRALVKQQSELLSTAYNARQEALFLSDEVMAKALNCSLGGFQGMLDGRNGINIEQMTTLARLLSVEPDDLLSFLPPDDALIQRLTAPLPDLFQLQHRLPAPLQELLARHAQDEMDYDDLLDLEKEVALHGYTFEFGLEAEPFNLRAMTPQEIRDRDQAPDDDLYIVSDQADGVAQQQERITWLTHDTKTPIFSANSALAADQGRVFLKLPTEAQLADFIKPNPGGAPLLHVANDLVKALVYAHSAEGGFISEPAYQGNGLIGGLDAHGLAAVLNLPSMLTGGLLAKEHAEDALREVMKFHDVDFARVASLVFKGASSADDLRMAQRETLEGLGPITQDLRDLGNLVHSYEDLPPDVGYNARYGLQFSFEPGAYDPAADWSTPCDADHIAESIQENQTSVVLAFTLESTIELDPDNITPDSIRAAYLRKLTRLSDEDLMQALDAPAHTAAAESSTPNRP